MKEIKFIAKSELVYKFVPPPKPSKLYLPKWFKDTDRYLPKTHPKISLKENQTIKGCMPVFDSISMGYIQESWCDLYVEDIDGDKFFKTSCEIPIVGKKTIESQGKISQPEGFYKQMFNFTRPWLPKTPNGYSVVYIHPSWNTDLPFQVFPGVVDSDVYIGAGDASPPFFIKKSFSGLIPKGTPLYQILIISNDSWKSNKEKYEKYKDILEKNKFINTSVFKNSYRKFFRKNKIYL